MHEKKKKKDSKDVKEGTEWKLISTSALAWFGPAEPRVPSLERGSFRLNLKETWDRILGRCLLLQLPPGVGWRELVHIARFVMSFVSQVEGQLVPQTHFLL